MILAISYTVYSFFSFLFAYFFSMLGKPVNFILLNTISLLTILLILFYLIKNKFFNFKFELKINLFVFTFIFIYFLFIFVSYNNGLRFPFISGWDSAVHFSMMRDAMERKAVLTEGSKTLALVFDYPEKIKDAPNYYPPGFYLPNAFLGGNFLNFVEKSNLLIFMVNWYFFIQIFLIAVSLIVFIYNIKQLLEINKINFNFLVSFIFGIFLFFGSIQLTNLVIGFASFISFFLFFNLAVFFLFKLQKEERLIFYFFYLLCIYLTNASWYLPFLAFLASGIIPLINKDNWKKISFISLFLFFIISFIHFILNFILTKNFDYSFAKSAVTTASGGVQIFNFFYIALVFLLTYYFFRDKDRRIKNNLSFLFLIIYISYIVLLGLFHFINHRPFNYYYYKSLIPLVSFCLYFSFLSFYFIFKNKNNIISFNMNFMNWTFKTEIKKDKQEDFSKDKNYQKKLYKFEYYFFICVLFFIFGKISVEKIGVLNFVSYFSVSPIIKKETQNAMFIINEIFDLRNKMIAFFPIHPTITLWTGALYGRNLSFFNYNTNWENWSLSDINKIKENFFDYVKKERSKYKILVVDTECYFSKYDIKKFQKANKRLIFYNPGCFK